MDKGNAATVNPLAHDLRPWLLLAGLVPIILVCYWSTFASMAQLWWHSETYAHGMFIFPIAAWLIYRERGRIPWQAIAPGWPAVGLLIVAGFIWSVAHAANINVIQQFAVIALIPLVIWAVLGWSITRVILFPLGFLFLAVPVGDEFRPQLIEFVADFVTTALRITGIPVYREGNFFTIPSGSWSVVQGCSGLRYLMATLTVGLLFAYLNFRSVWRRVVFVGASLVVALLGNGMRAYLIVMIAHLSDMKLALGIDHYIYGWVFFGILIFIVMWIGAMWREPEAAVAAESETRIANMQSSPSARGRMAALLPIAVIGLVVLWPALRAYAMRAASEGSSNIFLPERIGAWQAAEARLSDWRPVYVGTDAGAERVYQLDHAVVGALVYLYTSQGQGSELINAQNYLAEEKDPNWRVVFNEPQRLMGGGIDSDVIDASIKARDGTSDVLVWQFYFVNGRVTTNPFLVKLYEVAGSLRGQNRRGAAVIFYTSATDGPDAARRVLQEFTATAAAPIVAAIAGD